MANSKSLSVVKKLAERKEADAMTLLQSHQGQLQSDLAQYQQIDEYYQEYIGKITTQRSISIGDLKSYRLFAHQLSDSMTQMQQKIDRLQGVITQLQSNWLLLKKKREAIDELIARAAAEAQSEEDRIEQKIADELINQRSHYENKSPYSSS
ncbi:hypothetical protein NBRC116493_19570 [Aurantivibrio infirmus]